MRTKEEIINALKVIKEVCEENYCEFCPLRDKHYEGEYSRCNIDQNNPEHWDIAEDYVWFAFKD